MVACGVWTVLSFLFVVYASAEKGSPIDKVIDLLGVLEKQIEDDGLADGEAYVKYRKWYDSEVDNMKRIIEESTQTIESLQADLEEQSAFRQGKTQEFETASAKLSSSEKEMADAKLIREKEHKDFIANEISLVNGVEQLEKSLDVLAKQAPADSAAASGASASLLEVAQKLQAALVGSGDFTLSSGQKETLSAFVEASKRDAGLLAPNQASSAPDFLQVQTQSSGPDDVGSYESQTSGVTNTLQAVLDKVNEQLDAARETEGNQKKQYDNFAEALDQEITNLKNTRDELKAQITQSQQKSSEMEAQLAKTVEVLKVTKDQLQNTKDEFSVKTKNYKIRAAKRSDEIMAVQEAHQILSSQSMPAASIGGADFLQVRKLTGRGGKLLAKALSRTGVSKNASAVNFVQVRSHSHTRRSRRRARGPFTKVKNMITSMLKNLEDQAGKEAKHKEWCDREMKTSLTSKAEQEADIQKLTSRIDAMDAELSQVVNDFKTLQEDLSNLHATASSAAAIRKMEHHQATTAVAEYKDAQKVIQAAIDALRKFYGSEENLLQKSTQRGSQNPDSDSGYQAQGGGGGVIGILEVALQDYADLQSDVSLAEKEAADEFKSFMQESEVRIAVFEKGLEYKSRTKIKLEGDLLRSNADLKSYQKELDAVEEYLRELESQCIGKVDSYQERKDRRNKQLASLKEALQYLNGEIV